MIKANELRIGNYVSDNLGGTLKINGINKDSTTSHLKPIPLTEEWLFKFKFIKDSKYDYVIEKKDFVIVCYYDNKWDDVNNGSCSIIFKGGHSIDFNHVHQLQNLYFALTNKELS